MNGVAQRWNHGRESYRTDRDTIDPRRHGVEELDELEAKRFLVAHHYAGSESYPATQCRVGLYRASGLGAPRLVGAAVFGIPQHSAALVKWTGLPAEQAVV